MKAWLIGGPNIELIVLKKEQIEGVINSLCWLYDNDEEDYTATEIEVSL